MKTKIRNLNQIKPNQIESTQKQNIRDQTVALVEVGMKRDTHSITIYIRND